jgi:hypothetical protein
VKWRDDSNGRVRETMMYIVWISLYCYHFCIYMDFICAILELRILKMKIDNPLNLNLLTPASR